jgi:dTDP-4-amino-4,6-dideoxygalactose transaminase
LRNYGSEKKYHYNQIGWNNRMDGIQALVLSEKINHLDHWNNKRFQLAELYDANLSNIDQVITPKNAPYCTKNVYHIYCIRVINRENLQKFLNDFEIPTIIHYPVPIQNTTIYNFLNKNENHNTTSWCNNILSLPMHPYMLESEVEYISEKIRLFYQNTNN